MEQTVGPYPEKNLGFMSRKFAQYKQVNNLTHDQSFMSSLTTAKQLESR